MGLSVHDFTNTFHWNAAREMARARSVTEDAQLREELSEISKVTLLGWTMRAELNIDRRQAASLGNTCLAMIDHSFGGDSQQWSMFVRKIGNSPVGHFELDGLTQSGTMAKLANLEKSHPKIFDAVIEGSYLNIADLNKKLDEIAKPASHHLKHGAAVQTFRADDSRPVRELMHPVSFNGNMANDWVGAQSAHKETIAEAAVRVLDALAQVIKPKQ